MEKKYAHENTTRMPNGKTEINGIDVGYYIDTYKWVPTDYELSAEDNANMQRNDYFVSYGADEVSETKVCYVVWYQDDIRYSIMAYQEMPAEMLFEMAKELISGGN